MKDLRTIETVKEKSAMDGLDMAILYRGVKSPSAVFILDKLEEHTSLLGNEASGTSAT